MKNRLLPCALATSTLVLGTSASVGSGVLYYHCMQ